MEKIKKLKKIWLKLCNQAGAIGDTEGVFDEITARYCESHRYYHTLDHILDCFGQLDSVAHFANNPLALGFAVMFHDVVYNVGPKVSDHENVEQSTKLASELMAKLHLDSVLIARTEELIRATKHDIVPSEKDGRLMVDIDLSSLATPQEIFDQNTNNIRKEFAWVPDNDFKKGRAEFFRKLIANRHSIYSTDYFRNRYEAQAQTNIARAITAGK